MPSALVLVDTNVLVYAEDRSHADKHRAARAWLYRALSDDGGASR